MIDAYAAGIIDGEGCITIAQHGKGQWFSVRIDVGMSDKSIALLEALKQNYGGSVRQTREATEKWEASSAWGIFGKEAATFLLKIEQHLFLKVEQARLALRLQEILDTLPRNTNGSAHWTDEARQRGSAIRLRVQELNRKGPDTTQTPEEGWFARLVVGQWVTPQQSMFADLGLDVFSETWPRSGMARSGIAYRLPTLAPRISGTESSFWATPTVADARGHAYTYDQGNKNKPRLSLVGMARMWPTPTTSDATGGPGSSGRQGGPNLRTAVRCYPTSTAMNKTGGAAFCKWGGSGAGKRLRQLVSDQELNGALNPAWVEWLMGFPLGWTDLEDSA